MATRHLGGDRIEQLGDRLIVITSSSHMPGWEVRKYRAPVIRFEGRSWRITDRIVLPDKSTRFELSAWDPNAGEIPGPEIDYTPDYVAVRDQAFAIGRR